MNKERNECKIGVLIVDDSENARIANKMSITDLLEQSGLAANEIGIHSAANMEEALSILRAQTIHVVLLDRDLGGNIDGIEHIPEILDIQPHARILVITGHDDTRLAVHAMNLGAEGYIVKSGRKEYLEYKNAQILHALKKAKTEIKRIRDGFVDKNIHGKYICKSPAMQAIDIQLKTLAQYAAPVLFLGDSGLGKTATAKRLGYLRGEALKQKDRPFFNINMANISKDLADSILFGHEKGSFTGADRSKQGLFELANDGDLFLDEIGETSLEVQAKLLKVIEEKEFCRVGGDKTFKTNARIIFATNKDLKEMVAQKAFREDLYARICTFDILLPSLEERKEDIPDICRAIISNLKKENNLTNLCYDSFPEALKEYLQRDNIPYNIRGIRNDLERLMIGSKATDFADWKSVLGISKKSVFHTKVPNEKISYQDFEKLPTSFLSEEDFPGFKIAKTLLEKKLLEEAASKCRTKKDMAKLLQLSESNIVVKMSKYNINLLANKEAS